MSRGAVEGGAKWVQDEWARNCFACNDSFSLLSRRHHCRKCGGVFCAACSSHRLALREGEPLHRVCDKCYAAAWPAEYSNTFALAAAMQSLTLRSAQGKSEGWLGHKGGAGGEEGEALEGLEGEEAARPPSPSHTNPAITHARLSLLRLHAHPEAKNPWFVEAYIKPLQAHITQLATEHAIALELESGGVENEDNNDDGDNLEPHNTDKAGGVRAGGGLHAHSDWGRGAPSSGVVRGGVEPDVGSDDEEEASDSGVGQDDVASPLALPRAAKVVAAKEIAQKKIAHTRKALANALEAAERLWAHPDVNTPDFKETYILPLEAMVEELSQELAAHSTAPLLSRMGMSVDAIEQFCRAHNIVADSPMLACTDAVQRETDFFQSSYVDMLAQQHQMGPVRERLIGAATHIVVYPKEYTLASILGVLQDMQTPGQRMFCWLEVFCQNAHHRPNLPVALPPYLPELQGLVSGTPNVVVLFHASLLHDLWTTYVLHTASRSGNHVAVGMPQDSWGEFEGSLGTPRLRQLADTARETRVERQQCATPYDKRAILKALEKERVADQAIATAHEVLLGWVTKQVRAALRASETELGWAHEASVALRSNLSLLIDPPPTRKSQFPTNQPESYACRRLWDTVARVRKGGVVVHCLTNLVSMDLVASGLLALGCTPSMLTSMPELAYAIKALADGGGVLYINTATPSREWARIFRQAVQDAKALNVPWVLDPVATGFTPFRLRLLGELTRIATPTVARVNANEVPALAKALQIEVPEVRRQLLGRPDELSRDVIHAARKVSEATGTVLAVWGVQRREQAKGEDDNAGSRKWEGRHLVTNGQQLLEVAYDLDQFLHLVGSGRSLLSAIVSVFVSARPKEVDALWATAHAIAFCGICAEYAGGQEEEGGASFRAAFVDALYAYHDSREVAIAHRDWPR